MQNMQTANSNLPAALSNLGNALIQEGEAATGLGGDLLKFLARQGGSWVYGKEGTDVEEGSLWAANPMSFEHGFVCWKDQKVAGEHMVGVGIAKPDQLSLPDNGQDSKGNATKWQGQMSIKLKCTSGEDKGVEVIYKTSTVGGVSAIKALAKAVGNQINSGTLAVAPLVELEVDSYQHSDYGKMYTPVLKVNSWVNMDGTAGNSEPEEVEEEEKPKARRRRS